MRLIDDLITDPKTKCFAFVGDQNRQYLIEWFAEELDRLGKKVVVTHPDGAMLPSTGRIVIEGNFEALQKELLRNLNTESIVYLGKGLSDNRVKGLTEKEIEKISLKKEFDFLLVDVPALTGSALLTRQQIQQLYNWKFVDSLIYCIALEQVDRETSGGQMLHHQKLLDDFPTLLSDGVLTQEKFVRYLTDEQNGLMKLFRKFEHYVIVLSAGEKLVMENRAISFARELSQFDLKPIYLANLKENLFKRII